MTRVLVTAASKHDATAEIAEAIAEVLAGSAVYAGHWLKPARALADRCAPALRARPVWLFSSGPVGDPAKPPPPTPGARRARPGRPWGACSTCRSGNRLAAS